MILAMDIGSGTQDILLYEEGERVENMVQMILPSPTTLLAQKIREATKEQIPICLTGHLMGGGPSVRAIKDHMREGLKVYSLPYPALTIKDDLEYVKDLGVILVEEVPEGVLPIEMGDLSLSSLSQSFQAWGIEMPKEYALAVQDHGFSTEESNRIVRFRHWERFLNQGGLLDDLVFFKPPDYFTRMQALKRVLPGSVVMDTGAAAVFGALKDEEVFKEAKEEGVVVVNIGNQHTLGVLLHGEIIYGIFEHHTSLLNDREILQLIDSLREGSLTNEEVFLHGGHGAAYGDSLPPFPFSFVAVTGPKRDILKRHPLHFAAPFGDMMLTGCFGLIEGFKRLKREKNEKE